MKVLVTGGLGFTGSALSLALAEAGHEVVALDRAPGLFDDALRERGVRTELGSVTDGALVSRLMEGCVRVHHLAAAFRQVNLGRQAYWEVNVEGTRNVLEAARANGGPRVVNCSTCGVHGDVKEPPAAESAPIAPADHYQYTKWEGERLAMSYAERGQWVCTLRPAAIYGPGDPERFFLLFERVARGRFTFLGDGSALYHPLYIDNLVDAFRRAAEADAAEGQSYLVADAEYLPIRELVERTAAAIGVECRLRFLPFAPAYALAFLVEQAWRPLPAEPPLFRRRLDWFRQNRAFSIEKARRELGYEPAVGLDEGLRRTGAWYEERGMLPARPR